MNSEAVFVDKTRALDIDMAPAVPVTVTSAMGEVRGRDREMAHV